MSKCYGDEFDDLKSRSCELEEVKAALFKLKSAIYGDEVPDNMSIDDLADIANSARELLETLQRQLTELKSSIYGQRLISNDELLNELLGHSNELSNILKDKYEVVAKSYEYKKDFDALKSRL